MKIERKIKREEEKRIWSENERRKMKAHGYVKKSYCYNNSMKFKHKIVI